ncbi:MAG: D-3-phosphoglycerate dehydrogenase [Pirellulaceae bacterium]
MNCARGGIYNEAALVEGLKSGKLGGVALDVYDTEPCTDSPLFGMDNVVCTPHLGASTEEAQTQVAIEACQLIINFLTTGEIRNAINTAAVDPQTLDSLRGSLEVAYRLGIFLSQWNEGSANSCSVTYRGDIRGKDTSLLTSAFCAGLLKRAIEGVSIINAAILLKERGVQLSTQLQSDTGMFASSITATVVSNGKEFVAGGTLFGNEMPRLIRLGEFLLEAYLDGILLIFTHNDVPGIIGAVGTIFGNHRVNIGQMSVGRSSKKNGSALGVLNLDSRPSQAAIDEVLVHPDIHSVHVIELPAAGERPPWLA